MPRKDLPIDPFLFYLGLSLCLLASGRVGLLALGGAGRLRRRHARLDLEKQRFAEEIAVAARAARADRPAYSGWEGERELQISAIVDETSDVKSFYLTDVDGRSLPRFEPGQYLTCHFSTPPGDKPLVRCYSLSDRPREEYYRLTVKRCTPPDDHPAAPPGRASNQLHAMNVGDALHVAAPRGGFFLDPRRRGPVVLIAGGIGVTPIAGMLAALVHASDDRDIYLFYGVRNSRQHALRDQLADLAGERANVHQFVAYSQPLASDKEFIDYQLRGRITDDYLREVVPTGSFDYYLCGPGKMMQSLVEGLLARGVAEEHILYEAFGPASIRRAAKATSPVVASDPPPTVRFAHSQQHTDWHLECESLLELIEGAGVPIESGCRAGNCGMCLARVLEGEFTTVKEPGVTPPAGHCLACISIPTSPLVLEL